MAQTKATKASVSNEQDDAPIVHQEEVVQGVGYNNTIKNLLANGARQIKNLRIKNVNFTEKDNHKLVSFTLANVIPGYERNEDTLEYEKGKVSTLFTSTYAISGAIKEDEDLAWMGNILNEKPEALNLILNGGTIDIIQQEFAAGEEIVNPFSTKKDPTGSVTDHDTIINHVIKFNLGNTGKKMADRLADKLLGF